MRRTRHESHGWMKLPPHANRFCAGNPNLQSKTNSGRSRGRTTYPREPRIVVDDLSSVIAQVNSIEIRAPARFPPRVQSEKPRSTLRSRYVTEKGSPTAGSKPRWSNFMRHAEFLDTLQPWA